MLQRPLLPVDVLSVAVKTKGIRVVPFVDAMQKEGRKDKVLSLSIVWILLTSLVWCLMFAFYRLHCL